MPTKGVLMMTQIPDNPLPAWTGELSLSPRACWSDGLLDDIWHATHVAAIGAPTKGMFVDHSETYASVHAHESPFLARGYGNPIISELGFEPGFATAYPSLAPYYPIQNPHMWMDPWMMQDYHGYWW